MKKFFQFLHIIVFIVCLSPATVSAAKKNRIKMNFNDVEVISFIKIIGKQTGRTFVFNSKVLKGKRITLISNQTFSSSEAFKIFESVLNINKLSTIEEGKVTRIIISKEAKSTTTPIFKKNLRLHAGAFVTRIIPVKHLDVRTVRSNLAPLISKNSLLVANENANVLILRDTKENTDRFADIVNSIDKIDHVLSSVNLDLVALSHANAVETAALLSKVFVPKAKKGAAKSAILKVLADKRTNNLILIGHPATLKKIKKLVFQLDNKIETDEGNIRVYTLKNANAKIIAGVLQKIVTTLKSAKKKQPSSTPSTIIPDIPSNSLVIYADQAEFPTLESVIRKLDIERAQVFIQALIMEVRLDKSLELGVEWQAGDQISSGDTDAFVTAGGVGATGAPKTFDQVKGAGAAGAVVGVIGGPITFGGTEFSTFNAFIKAMERDTEIDILSNPQILTLNNEEAEIKVGEIIPTVGSTSTDANGKETISIQYKEVGISLKITPQINANDAIELKIDENSSNVIEGKIGAFDQGAITTLNRSLKTKVVVNNGQTIVLGGLISDEITEVETKTPCLGDIPILGWLFKTRSTGTKKTNLLIFLTPHVVRDQDELEKVSEKAKSKVNNARQGRFRIDVSNEFGIPQKQEGKEESDNESEEEESESEEEGTPIENPEAENKTAE
ncbi:MAG: type II secretion system secretin GspD [Deltaproteobacteria bacterium]|jgi:general secretion pathway protein D|nr:type II secretion system secretin GspD [Deltaproteobacteria bacterium]